MNSLGNIFENKLNAMSDESFDRLSDDDKVAFALMYQMADVGVTPPDFDPPYGCQSQEIETQHRRRGWRSESPSSFEFNGIYVSQ